MRTLLVLLGTLFLIAPTSAQDLRVTGDAVPLAQADGAVFMNPRWSPNGQHLAFTGSNYQGLWIFDEATQTLDQLSDEPAAGFGFLWSPDGGALLTRVARFDGPRRQNAVKSFDVAEGTSRLLTEYRPSMPGLPRWSPDGATVYLYTKGRLEVFDAERPPAAAKASPDVPVLFMQDDRVGAVRLGGDRIQTFAPVEGKQVLNLVASPDGRRVAFEVMGGHLHVMNADGTSLRDLGPGHRPQWSPDGRWIAFMRTEDDGHRFTSADLFAIQPDADAPVQLTATPDRLEMNPSWSPDGTRIAFDADGVIYALPVAQ